MQIITDYKNCPEDARDCVIALGNFDGVHEGHRQIIKKTVDIAKDNNLPSAVMTFEPHPVLVFNPDIDNFRLTCLNKKAQLMDNLGVDYLFVIKFDKEFSSITAEKFISDILIGDVCVKHIVIGHDFIFGHKKGGNADLLREKSEEYGYGFTQVEAVGKDDVVFSSTKIRESLKRSDLSEVVKILGRNYTVAGVVVRGDNRGRSIGFPTINIDSGDYLWPGAGVYAVRVLLGGEIYNGVANIGDRPTFADAGKAFEVHIFNFNKDVYGVNVEVEFVEYIRPEQKFAGADELVVQIKDDCVKAEAILS